MGPEVLCLYKIVNFLLGFSSERLKVKHFFNEDLHRSKNLKREHKAVGPSGSEDGKSKANNNPGQPELKKKIISINNNVKPDLKEAIKGGDSSDTAREQRLKKANEKQVGAALA